MELRRRQPSHPIADNPDFVKRFRPPGSNEIRAAANEIVSGALRRNSPGETSNFATTPFWPCRSKLLKQDSGTIAVSIYEIDFCEQGDIDA
jgi:hypothetical protein